MELRKAIYKFLDNDRSCNIEGNIATFNTTLEKLNDEVNEIFGLRSDNHYVVDWLATHFKGQYTLIEKQLERGEYKSHVESILVGTKMIERIITETCGTMIRKRKIRYLDGEVHETSFWISGEWIKSDP